MSRSRKWHETRELFDDLCPSDCIKLICRTSVHNQCIHLLPCLVIHTHSHLTWSHDLHTWSHDPQHGHMIYTCHMIHSMVTWSTHGHMIYTWSHDLHTSHDPHMVTWSTQWSHDPQHGHMIHTWSHDLHTWSHDSQHGHMIHTHSHMIHT